MTSQTRSKILLGHLPAWLLVLGCEVSPGSLPSSDSGSSTGRPGTSSGAALTGTTTAVADSTGASSGDSEGSSTGRDDPPSTDGEPDGIGAYRVFISGQSNSTIVEPPVPIGTVDSFILSLTIDDIDTPVTSELLSTVIGPGNDLTEDIALSPSGVLFAVGCTSAQLFGTPGAYQPQPGGWMSAFVAAYAPDGSTLAATYLGANQSVCLTQAHAYEDGSVLVAGVASGDTVPGTPGAFQPMAPGSSDLLGARLEGDLSDLQWMTYLGGSNGETMSTSMIGPDGGWLVAGTTVSADFPTTVVPFPSTGHGMQWYPMVAEISGDGAGLEWSTYQGFDDGANVEAMHVLPNGELLLCGHIYVDGSLEDVWVAHVSPNASELLASQTVGGAGFDSCRAVSADAHGNVIVVARTRSPDFPVTSGVLQPYTTEPGDFPLDQAVFKLDSDLLHTMFSTFLSGNQTDWIGDSHLAVTAHGDAFISFDTRSTDLPVTNNSEVAYEPATYGNGYLARLSADGTRLRFATYIGRQSPGFNSFTEVTGMVIDPIE